MEKVLFLHEETEKLLNKDKLFSFLASKSLKKTFEKDWYHYELKAFYEDISDFILKHLDHTYCIQVYSDSTIRLHLEYGHYDSPKSIFIEDYDFCNNERNTEIIEELDSYSRYN